MGGKKCYNRIFNQKDQIVKDYLSGISIKKLANLYNVSSTPIRTLLLNLNISLRLPVRPLKLEKNKSEVIKLYQTGYNTKEIANIFKVDRNTVSLFLKKYKLLRNAPLAKREFHIKNDIDKGFLAGLIVGEGSIIIRGKLVRISISNQDPAIMGWLSKFGGRIHWSKPRKGSINPCACWNLSRTVDVFNCLILLYPYIIGKKKQLAKAALHVLKSNYGLSDIP